jgi:hypothetical protein
MRLIVILTLLIAGAAAAAAKANAPEPIRIEMNGVLTGPSTVEGTFSLTGFTQDSGRYVETFRFAGSTIHGEKTLVGATGTLVLRVQAVLEWLSPTRVQFAAGHWQIVSGTGSYAGLTGGGSPLSTDSAADLATGTVRVVHEGQVI